MEDNDQNLELLTKIWYHEIWIKNEVYVPDWATVTVNVGEKVRAGEYVIAKVKQK